MARSIKKENKIKEDLPGEKMTHGSEDSEVLEEMDSKLKTRKIEKSALKKILDHLNEDLNG